MTPQDRDAAIQLLKAIASNDHDTECMCSLCNLWMDLVTGPDPQPEVEKTLKHALALAEQGARMTWQPMETAPKDGTPVLCWTPHVMQVAYWENDEWWLLVGRGVIEAHLWMPLPAIPAGRTT